MYMRLFPQGRGKGERERERRGQILPSQYTHRPMKNKIMYYACITKLPCPNSITKINPGSTQQ